MNKKWIIGIISIFMFCCIFSSSVWGYHVEGIDGSGGGGSRGGSGGVETLEVQNHDTVTGDNDYGATSRKGGYAGKVDYSYDMTGQVEYQGKVITVSTTLETGSKNMNLHDLAAWDPRNDISSLYTYGGMGPNAALWAKLAADTGLGTAADWGNGNIKILGQGLHASINLNVHLTGQATIGDYKITDGVLNLSYPPASSDLKALLSGNALKALDGTTMIGKTTLAILAGKQDTVDFDQLMKELSDLIEAGEEVDVEKLLEEEEYEIEIPEDPEPMPMPNNPPSNKLSVSFDPPMCDWTNDPYDVYATVSGVYNRDDPAPVSLVNCWNHCADVTCPKRYCGGGHDGHWEDTYDKNTGQKTGSRWVTRTRPGCLCATCGYAPHVEHGPRTGTHDGYFVACYTWAHTCYRSTAKWAWELGVDVVRSDGSCGGSIIGTEGANTARLHWKIGILGEWSAMAHFVCLPNQTREGKHPSINYKSWPRTGNDRGDDWSAVLPDPAEITRSSGPYRFDDRMPILTVSTGEYGLGGTYTGNASVDAKNVFGGDPTRYWTNKNINFSVSLTDEHAGPDFGRSYIEINGKKLHAVDNYGPCNDHRGLGSFSLTQSGEYIIHFHCEDRAYLGCTSAEDGIPNFFDVYYYVYIDKIPPVLRYGFNDDLVLYNSKRDRYETTGMVYDGRTEPYWWITASDKYSTICPDYAASGLKEAWAYTTQDKAALEDPKTFAMKGEKFATANMGPNEWKHVMISDDALKAGYDVYLILYAIDNVGNESFTTTYIAKEADYITQSNPDHLAPKNHQHIEDTRQRRLPTAMIFIDRAKRIKVDGGTDDSAYGAPLEITRVLDVKWEGAIRREDKIANSKTFAVYRNDINDMIGLGYRVNFRYHLIGYGIDKGDKCTLQFELYGHKGNGFEKLDVYVQNPDGQTYSKVDSTHEYYRRTYEQTRDQLIQTWSVDDENNMLMNEGQYVQDNSNNNINDALLYFNYTIPATAKFKYTSAGNPAKAEGSDKDWYTGTEILVKVNLWSKKWMDTNSKIVYELLKDKCINWGPNGQIRQFYGTSYTVPSLGKGQAFWYDGTSTAITDITGHKSN